MFWDSHHKKGHGTIFPWANSSETEVSNNSLKNEKKQTACALYLLIYLNAGILQPGRFKHSIHTFRSHHSFSFRSLDLIAMSEFFPSFFLAGSLGYAFFLSHHHVSVPNQVAGLYFNYHCLLYSCSLRYLSTIVPKAFQQKSHR